MGINVYDQGFFDYRTMDLIDANDGWFVTRLKPNANPRIVEELRDWRGNAISLTDEKLHDVLDDLYRDVIDVRTEVSFRRRSYNNSRSGATQYLPPRSPEMNPLENCWLQLRAARANWLFRTLDDVKTYLLTTLPQLKSPEIYHYLC